MPSISLYDNVVNIYDSWVGSHLQDPVLDELIEVSTGD